MTSITRVFAFLNAAFQILVGLAAVVAPGLAAGIFGVPSGGAPAVTALIRMFGGLLAGAGLFAALVAVDPDRPRWFTRTLAVALLGNVVADVLVVGAGELGFGSVGGGMVLELIFAVLLLVSPSPTPSARPAG